MNPPLDRCGSVAVFVLNAALLLSGCTLMHSELGTGLPAEPPRFDANQASVGDVLDLLGPPLRVTVIPQGYAFLYSQLQVHERQLGLSVPDLDLIKFSFGNAYSIGWATLLFFDENGTLSEQVTASINEDLGKGVSVQIIVSVEETVDTSVLTGPESAHHWGMLRLQPLAAALNVQNGMDSGASGLEQRGTPTNVGQRTLENR